MAIGVDVCVFLDGKVSYDARLKDAIMSSRSELCNAINHGWIDRYNALCAELDMDGIDIYGYEEAYHALTRGYWTKRLNEHKGCDNLVVVDETFTPTGKANTYLMRVDVQTRE